MNKKNRIIWIIFFAVLVLAGSVFFMGKYFSRSKNQTIDLNKNNSELINSSTASEEIGSNVTNGIPENPIDRKENTADAGNSIQLEKKETTNNPLKVANKIVSWGFTKVNNNRSVDTIIIHSSYDASGSNPYSVNGLIQEYKDYGVAPHYLIDRAGTIYRLVDEQNIAYHAGEGQTPDGRTGINNFSIGIELMNTKTDKFTNEQYAALNKLIRDIKSRYKIKYVLGHNQIAPGRKDDPWNFDWKMIR